MSSTTSSASPSPSFLVRLRARARRQDGEVVQLPEDHWHAGDPRLVDGALALSGDVPSPRSPVDRRRLAAVPEVDVREPAVLDLRPSARPSGPDVPRPPAARRAPEEEALVERAERPLPSPAPVWSETSTWLG